MDYAFNKITGELVSALNLAINPSYKFIEDEIWFADPNIIETYDSTKISNISKIEVRYRKGNADVMNKWGTHYIMPPCFYILNKSELGINVIPESPEHKRVKTWIYNRILNKQLIFKISEVNKPFQYNNIINISSLDIDYNKVALEPSISNGKLNRADIIIPLREHNSILGFGIVIEVQFSKQFDSTTEERSLNWASKGYNVCWLFRDNFYNIADNIIELKEDNLNLTLASKIIQNQKAKAINEIKQITQDFARQIQNKLKELNFPFCIGECKQCDKGYMTKRRTKNGKEVYGCSNYPRCNHSIWVNE